MKLLQDKNVYQDPVLRNVFMLMLPTQMPMPPALVTFPDATVTQQLQG